MSQELIEMLQDAAAREISVSVQYMWHHIMAKGLASPEFRRIVKDISIVEMRHAEAIAERLDYLGEVPTTKPTPIDVGGSLLNMIDNDLTAERGAIELYKRIVAQAETELRRTIPGLTVALHAASVWGSDKTALDACNQAIANLK